MPDALFGLSRLTKSWKNIWAFELWKKNEDSSILNTVQKAKKTDICISFRRKMRNGKFIITAY